MHQRKISVVGLGYVGLPVAVAFGQRGHCIGFDINPGRIAELRRGEDSTLEVPPAELASANISFTAEPMDLREADFHIVAVPTPSTTPSDPTSRPCCARPRQSARC